jgi:serine/threonine protein kinase
MHHLGDHPDIQNDHQWSLRSKMALDIARGMAVLHKKIIHLDLKTSNVLVRQGYCCKISDFGSSEFLYESENSQFKQNESASVNTVAFAAPERFGGANHWTWKKQKADVYAYAMILLQLKQFEEPWQGETSAQVIKTNVLGRSRPRLKVDSCPKYAVILIKQCWTHDPDLRPDFPGI